MSNFKSTDKLLGDLELDLSGIDDDPSDIIIVQSNPNLKKKAFNDSSSSNLSVNSTSKIIQVETVDVHKIPTSMPPVPLPRKHLPQQKTLKNSISSPIVAIIKENEEILEISSVESEGDKKSISLIEVEKFSPVSSRRDGKVATPDSEKHNLFFAESRKNTIINSELPIRKPILEVQSSIDSSLKGSTHRSEEDHGKLLQEIPTMVEVVNEKSKMLIQRRNKKPKNVSETEEDITETDTENVSRENRMTEVYSASDSGTVRTVSEDLNKKKKKKKKSDDIEMDELGKRDMKIRKKKSKESSYQYEKIIGVYLHDVDQLEFDKRIRSPRVKVSWCDINSGQLIQKSDPQRNVVINNEPDTVNFIQPIISKPCRFRDSTHIECEWEELLIFNEDVDHLKQGKEIIFFEVIDILPTNESGEWFNICWAFLKPFPDKKFSNLDKRCRLQLYKYQTGIRKLRTKNESIFDQWNAKRKIYPGTLYVTVKELKPNLNYGDITSRSMNVLQEEKLEDIMTINDDQEEEKFFANDTVDKFNETQDQDPVEDFQRKWRRLPGQVSRFPNLLLKKVKTANKGSYGAKFNFTGHLVAFSSVSKDQVDIIIATVPEMKIIHTLEGHNNLIYDLDWCGRTEITDGQVFPQFLLSASADRMAIVWQLERKSYSLKILPHPSFVYSAKFLSPKGVTIFVVTGGRDGIVRIWSSNSKRSTYDLRQELAGHGDSYITSIACSKDFMSFLSGDSQGVIFEWTKNESNLFDMARKIEINKKNKEPIFGIIQHPRGGKIFVTSKNQAIAVVDLHSGIVIQSYGEITSKELKSQRRCTLTPCGTFLYSTENMKIRCWNTFSGQEQSISIQLPLLPKNTFLSCIDYHPKGSFLIVTIYGTDRGVILYGYQTNSADIPANGIRPMEKLKIPKFKQVSTDVKRKIAVKNQLSDIIRRIDDVFLIPRNRQHWSDDAKLMEREMVKNKEDIKKWLADVDVETSTRPPVDKLSVVSSRSGTYTVDAELDNQQPHSSSIKSGTFTLEKAQPLQRTSNENLTFLVEKNDVTYDVNNPQENDSDDTTISSDQLE